MECSKRFKYCKTLFFHCILISRFSCVEDSLHFNLADFLVNIIKQFVSCFFWCLYQILLLNSYHIIVYYQEYWYHRRKCWHFTEINLRWSAIQKIRVYLILLFYSNPEKCENLMLAKYTCFTVRRYEQKISTEWINLAVCSAGLAPRANVNNTSELTTSGRPAIKKRHKKRATSSDELLETQ